MQILNVKIDNINTSETFQKVQKFLKSNTQHHISTVNPEYILEAQKDKEFQEIINSSSLSVPDGIGIIWAAKFLSLSASKNIILRYPQVVIQYIYTGASLIFWPKYCKSVIKERVSGADLCEKITNYELRITKNQKSEIRNRFSIFLLGGFNGIGKKIQEKYPDVIIGAYEGSPDLQNDEKIRNIINNAKPNILFAAYGNPASKQEKWISRNLKYLPSVKVAMGVGGSFDFLSGGVKRAPEWMRKIGLEWLFRLIKQPRRIGRIWNAVIIFSGKVLIYKFGSSLSIVGKYF